MNNQNEIMQINRLNTLLETIANGIQEQILLLSIDFKIMWANKTMLEFEDKTLEEITGSYCYKITHNLEKPCEPPFHICPIIEVLKTEKTKIIEHTHFGKNGNKITVEVTVYPIMDEKGEIAQFIHISRDITEQKNREEKLIESEKKYKHLVENIRENYFIFSSDGIGQLRYVSPSVTAVLGYSQDEFKMNHLNFWTDHPANLKAKEHFKLSTKGQKQAPYELQIIHKNGDLVWLEIDGIPMLDDRGKVLSVDAIAKDITELKKTDKKIKFMATILETASHSVIATDDKYKIIYLNAAAEKMFGYSKDELIGKDPAILNAVASSEDSQKEIYETIVQGNIWRGELPNKRKNGEIFWISLSVYKLCDNDGSFLAYVGFQEEIKRDAETNK